MRSLQQIPPEYVVYGMMGLNAAVFVAWQLAGPRNFMYAHFCSSYAHLRGGYLHTLLTSSVSHSSLGHLFTNMFTFYFFGQSVVQHLGVARVRRRTADPTDGLAALARRRCMLRARLAFHAC